MSRHLAAVPVDTPQPETPADPVDQHAATVAAILWPDSPDLPAEENDQ